ncbi:MAG: hypothetical protein H6993_17560 [Pseudomonadales bacterium]|nr:hypothetical protein [Pseudomonadales bacterium]MCP5185775.1 hypothetical protein [Pseudomonadales bacterium]
MTKRAIAAMVLLLAAVPASQGARPADSLQSAMSAEEFTRAGLHRLTPEELAYLNGYLGRADAASATPVPALPDAAFGEETLARKPSVAPDATQVMRSRVKGAFTGWSGHTVFRLENGQVWQQRNTGNYSYRVDSPEIEIERGRFGYYLRVLSTGRQIGVKRLK